MEKFRVVPQDGSSQGLKNQITFTCTVKKTCGFEREFQEEKRTRGETKKGA